MTPLSKVEKQRDGFTSDLDDLSRAYRRVARGYEGQLRRILKATAVPAEGLRMFAAEALGLKEKKRW